MEDRVYTIDDIKKIATGRDFPTEPIRVELDAALWLAMGNAKYDGWIFVSGSLQHEYVIVRFD